MKLGIVGLPNVGKSTLFNAITNAGAESANYPFCTIDPNVGMVAVPDERLDKLAEMYEPDKKTPGCHRICGYCRPGEGRRPRARVWATSSWPISGRRMPSSMSSAALTIENVIHVEGGTDPSPRHRHHQPGAGHGGSGNGDPPGGKGHAKMSKSGDKKYRP
jgi:hypothetical protein